MMRSETLRRLSELENGLGRRLYEQQIEERIRGIIAAGNGEESRTKISQLNSEITARGYDVDWYVRRFPENMQAAIREAFHRRYMKEHPDEYSQ